MSENQAVLIDKSGVKLVKGVMGYDHNKDIETFIPISNSKRLEHIDFNSRLSSINSSNDFIIPTNCKYIRKLNNQYTLFVIEEPPAVRTIKVNLEFNMVIENLITTGNLEEFGFENFLKNKPPYEFNLSFPYVIFMIVLNTITGTYQQVKVFFRLHPINSLHDYLLIPNLTNIHDDRSCCLGELNGAGGFVKGNDLNDTIFNVINAFWLNEYNSDLMSTYDSYKNVYELKSFLHWDYFTRLDPMFIFSTQWKSHPKNIIQELEVISRSIRGLEDNKRDFFNVARELILSQNLNNLKNYENIPSNCLSITFVYGESFLLLTIGDEIKLEDKNYYIYEFVGNIQIDKTSGQVLIDQSSITKIKLEDDEKNIILKDFNNDFKKLIFEQQSANDIKEIEVNNTSLKIGNLIQFIESGMNFYKKVEKFRVNKYGKYEFLSCGDYYNIETFKGKIVDPENFELNGHKLVKGNKYIHNKTLGHQGVITYGMIKMKFESLNIESNRRMILTFIKSDGDSFRMFDTDFKAQVVVDNDENQGNLNLFRIGNKLFINNERNCIYIKGEGRIITSDMNYSRKIQTNNTVCNTLIESEKVVCLNRLEYVRQNAIVDNKFCIKSYDLDIELEIGNNIVFVNWEVPQEMFITRTITGFRFCEETFKMYIDTKDRNGNEKSIEYINFKDFTINIEKVRKCVSSLGSISIGDKVRNVGERIQCFLKKDIHMVMNIIVDSGSYPLILCSNYCCIWAETSNLESFEFVKNNSPEYTKLKVTIFEDTKHIQPKPGDIVSFKNKTRSNDQWIKSVYMEDWMVTMSMIFTGEYPEGTYPNNSIEIKQEGLYIQRTSDTKRRDFPYKYAISNLMGSFIKDPRSNQSIRLDWRFHNV